MKKATILGTMLAIGALIVAAAGCGDGNGGTTCPTGQQVCSGVCVDTRTDANNCGGCNNQCGASSQCVNSTCTTPCTPVQETCDGIDNDCDTSVDENLTRDCNNPCGTGTQTCSDGAWGTCNAPTPTAETCDNLDNDCDGAIDEDVKTRYYRDSDADNYGDPNTFQDACAAPTGYVTDHTDCDDTTNTRRPGNPELCTNSVDDDCDGTTNEDCTCTAGTTQQCGEGGDTGDCDWGTQTCGSGGTWGACTGGRRPTAETCNGTDENCDGQTDNGLVEDTYEINDTCAQARVLPRADEGLGTQTVSTPTLYSSDGSDDTDWYFIEANEASHLECILHPLDDQCYFYLDISLKPPAGADHTKWSYCVHLAVDEADNCTAFDYNFCTDETTWTGTEYAMTLTWSGSCGLDDGWKFYVEVDGATNEESCLPYTLEYTFDFEGGIGTDYCT
jgi:hypothetical protein